MLFETETAGDTATAPTAYFDEQASMFQRKHYGLIAQEVQELYPDLVYEDDNGYLSIDYIGLIPLLIQSVKELNAKIETMNSLGTGLSKSTHEPLRAQVTWMVCRQKSRQRCTKTLLIRFRKLPV